MQQIQSFIMLCQTCSNFKPFNSLGTVFYFGCPCCKMQNIPNCVMIHFFRLHKCLFLHVYLRYMKQKMVGRLICTELVSSDWSNQRSTTKRILGCSDFFSIADQKTYVKVSHEPEKLKCYKNNFLEVGQYKTVSGSVFIVVVVEL